MCDINFKSKLKRRKTFVENQQGTQSPREAPNGNPTWRNADGEESAEVPAIPESRARGGPQAGRGESKAGTGPSRSPGTCSLFHNPEIGTEPPDCGNTFGQLLPDRQGVPKKSPLGGYFLLLKFCLLVCVKEVFGWRAQNDE